MMHTSAFIAPLLVILAAARPMVKRDPATVEADLATYITNVHVLDTDLTAFSNTTGTLAQAMVIHTDIIAVNSSMAIIVTHLEGSVLFDIADSLVILSDIITLEPVSLDVLSQLTNKKPGFDLVGFSSTILDDLKSLQIGCLTLEDALLDVLSIDILSQLNTIIQATGAAISEAIVVYSEP